MWHRVILFSALAGLAACSNQPPSSVESNASVCQMLKQKVETNDYTWQDPSTMQRKNAAERAKQIKEFDYYSCPEIVNSAPPPNYTEGGLSKLPPNTPAQEAKAQ